MLLLQDLNCITAKILDLVSGTFFVCYTPDNLFTGDANSKNDLVKHQLIFLFSFFFFMNVLAQNEKNRVFNVLSFSIHDLTITNLQYKQKIMFQMKKTRKNYQHTFT